MQNNSIATIGDNNPPTDAEILKQKLRDTHKTPLSRAEQLIADAANLPGVINNDDEAKARADFIKEMIASGKTLEALRTNEKEPYLTLGRVVDGFFKSVTDTLDKTKANINQPLTAYLKRKDDEAKRKLREEAEEARRVAEQQRLIANAADKAKEAETAADMRSQATISDLGAARLEKMAEAKPAELSRTRSASGAVASLKTWWVGEITNLAALDLEVLRHHINPDALQTALNSYVKAGGREISGAHIYEKSESVTR